jgi:KUP system potassium uptake protein
MREEKHLGALRLASLGIVFGDIGTSPLYALRESFFGAHRITPSPENVLGILSLIIWALILVVSVKYLVFILRADNDGEGGILALLALLNPWRESGTRRSRVMIAIGLMGAALLYGDSIITPAISVLSAVEGLQASGIHGLHAFVIPITVTVLLGLFVLQPYGTARIAKLFAPVMLLWFVVLMLLGIKGVCAAPEVLWSFNPVLGVRFLFHNPGLAAVVLGAVFLAVTGGEALYADMGHFGPAPIRLAWFGLVLPALLLNYLGQGAGLIASSGLNTQPFYDLAPSGLRLPLVLLATAAAVIASQAVISGAFSLTRQAVQLHQWPRVNIIQTSASEMGQIYVPFVNWFLMVCTIGLVLGFGSSSSLAGAYGLAVSMTMVITILLAYQVARRRWRWPLPWAVLVIGPLLGIDLLFFGANTLKVVNGGWFPLLTGGLIYLLMNTWSHGRELVVDRRELDGPSVDSFLARVRVERPVHVPGTAVFMTSAQETVPTTLVHHLEHNRVLHECVVLATVVSERVPYMSSVRRLDVRFLGEGVWRLRIHYGFLESPDVPAALRISEELSCIPGFKESEAIYYLGRTIMIPSRRIHGMALWRERLFAFMARNGLNATAFYQIPPERVVELGIQVEF